MSLGAIGTAVAVGAATAVGSAVASKAMGSMFGNEGQVQQAYDPAIQALNANAQRSGQYAEETFDWGESTWASLDDQTRDIVSRLEPIAAQQGEMALTLSRAPEKIQGIGQGLAATGTRVTGYGEEALDWHRGTYQPLEGEWIQDYRDFTSEGRKALEGSRAAADVSQAFEAQRNNALRQLEGYGIDPGQARHGALDLNVRLAEAATQGQVITDAQRYVEEQGRQMREGILKYGAQYPGWGNQALQTGTAATEAGGNLVGQGVTAGRGVSSILGDQARTNLAGGQLGNQTARTGADMFRVPSSYISGATAASAGQLGGVEAQQRGTAAERGRYDTLGEYAGSALGDAVQGYFDNRTSDAGNSTITLGTGSPASVAATNALVTPDAFARGGEVEGPGGPYDDQVPIKASDGEFIIPYEVVHRLGTKHFDNLINKTREELQALPS